MQMVDEHRWNAANLGERMGWKKIDSYFLASLPRIHCLQCRHYRCRSCYWDCLCHALMVKTQLKLLAFVLAKEDLELKCGTFQSLAGGFMRDL